MGFYVTVRMLCTSSSSGDPGVASALLNYSHSDYAVGGARWRSVLRIADVKRLTTVASLT
jgi:hypothetical protein